MCCNNPSCTFTGVLGRVQARHFSLSAVKVVDQPLRLLQCIVIHRHVQVILLGLQARGSECSGSTVTDSAILDLDTGGCSVTQPLDADVSSGWLTARVCVASGLVRFRPCLSLLDCVTAVHEHHHTAPLLARGIPSLA